MKAETVKQLFEDVFFTVPVGLFIVNKNKEICAWNHSMEKMSGISEKDALTKTLNALYPNENYFRYEWALEQVLSYSNPQFMSQALNSYLIPSELKDELGFGVLSMMQQTVEIHPINDNSQPYALVIIQDVTMVSHQQNTLLNMAKRFENESLFDELTGIYNRKFIPTWFNIEIKNSMINGKGIACALFDLDYFKQVNDTYGHKAGDDVLVSFVDVVNTTLRDGDMFARYGGEEFVVFTLLKPTDDPCGFSERVRKKLELIKSHGEVAIPVTCSVGVAVWTPNDNVIITAQELIDKADSVLYEAKETGRNKVCLYKKD